MKMKEKIFFFSILSIIILSVVFYFLLSKKDNVYVCSVIEMECPDGFLSKCNFIFDPSIKSCVECIPDCTGHETPINRTGNNSTRIILCPDISPSENFCKGGKLVPIYDNNTGCAIDYRCK